MKSDASGRPGITMDCPVDGCGKNAEAWLPGVVEVDVEVLDGRATLEACTKAVIDALVGHIEEDHVGHGFLCPRGVDRDAKCSCALASLKCQDCDCALTNADAIHPFARPFHGVVLCKDCLARRWGTESGAL